MDFESRYDSAITEGLMEGRAQGLEEGKAQGLEEGKAQGLEEGIAKGLAEGIAQAEEKNKQKSEKERISLIKNMLTKGIDINTISEITNTSIDDIYKLK
jgi:flagellar biosynthesis/type III secretory pathway protein FliH